MIRSFRPLFALGLALSSLQAQVPVKRVVLYKSGVGYFEHLGRVRNNEDVSIAFTSGQLNDVLKSLTVLDLGGGRVTGVTYTSAAPIERQLGELNLPLGQNATLTEFLGALRGAKVEIRTGTAVAAGRLLSVERKTRMSGGATLEVDYLSMITDAGEVKTVELTPGFSFRLLEKNLTAKLDKYLDLVGSMRDADVRRMVISTAGTGERQFFVSYVSEVPVWKATYRLVLDSKHAAESLLQGWAVVDNTVGQDWENVELSLVAGAPQSFVQEISKPYYARRPIVAMSQQMMATPQTHEARLFAGSARVTGQVTDPTGAAIAGATVRVLDGTGSLAGQTTTDASGSYSLAALPEGVSRIEIAAPGFRTAVYSGVTLSASRESRQDARLNLGSVAESVAVAASRSLPMAATSEPTTYPRSTGSGRGLGSGGALGSGRGPGVAGGTVGGLGGGVYLASEGQDVRATSQELGDLFEYKLKEPITISKNQSALVPIVHAKVAVEKVSLWNDANGLTRPRRALWVTNSSGVTLDGGSFSVMEDDTFAGEGLFEPIRPGDKRLVSYAVDLAVTAKSAQDSATERVTRVRVAKGSLIQTREVRESKTYTFRNEDSKPRIIIVEHPARSGWELKSDVKPVETTAGSMRFRVAVDPKQTAVLSVKESMPVDSVVAISNVTSDLLVQFSSQRSISPAIEEALRGVLTRRAGVDALSDKADALGQEKDRIYDDQQRLRENIKSLKGSAEERSLLQRYTSQLNSQETRLAELEATIAKVEAETAAAEAELDRYVMGLAFDTTL